PDREEVDCPDRPRLRPQEPTPGGPASPRRPANPGAAQDRPDRRRAQPDPELAQLTLNPHTAPARILPPQPQHQLPQLGRNRRTTRWPTPIRPTAAAPA